jgi:hypothetical protein
MKPMRIGVGVKKREDTGEFQNIIKSYKPRNGNPVEYAQTASGTKTPW